MKSSMTSQNFQPIRAIALALFAAMSLILASNAAAQPMETAYGQSVPFPIQSTSIASLRSAMSDSWKSSGYGYTRWGYTGFEAGFVLNGNKEHFTIEKVGWDNGIGLLHMTVNPTTFAMYHVHPNTSLPTPSKADVDIANKYHVLMFVMSRFGLYVYDPDTGMTTKVAQNLEWLTQ